MHINFENKLKIYAHPTQSQGDPNGILGKHKHK